jgi:hypothetical protein
MPIVMGNKILLITLLILSCLTQGGCALVGLPFQLLGTAFDLIKGVTSAAVNIAQQLPMPPPWVFF